MAIGIHVVNVGQFTVDSSGNRVNKNDANTSIGTLKSTSHAWLVIPSSDIPNSASYPTITAYLKAEAADNYILKHIDQTMIVTYDQSDINGV